MSIFQRLASHDVVLTTYNIIAKEVELDDNDKNGEKPVKDDGDEDDVKKEGAESKVTSCLDDTGCRYQLLGMDMCGKF